MSFVDTIFNWLPKLRAPDLTLRDAQCTPDGYLKISIAENAAAATTWVDPDPGTPLTDRKIIATTANRRLHQLIGVNEGASSRWLMVFNSPTNPVNGAEPLFAFPVGAGGVAVLELPRPRTFSAGIAWAISSTAGTYTRDAAATFRVHAEVI